MSESNASRIDGSQANFKPRKEPRGSKFTQQELPAWRPVLSPYWVTGLFFLLAVVLVPVGLGCLFASQEVIEVRFRYDDMPFCTGSKSTTEEKELSVTKGDGVNCSIAFQVSKPMQPPIFVYYDIKNFYQNHRRYVRSRSDPQLLGEKLGSKKLKDCQPKLWLNESGIINPCGLIAWSFFNDSYRISMSDNNKNLAWEELHIRSDGIAWKSDLENKFGDYIPENFNTIESLRGGGEINGSVKNDERFAVWMRTASLPHFRKLWGVIDHSIPANTPMKIDIKNRYNTYRFRGQKSIVLSTTTWLGGKNDVIGISYMTAGAISMLCSATYLFLHFRFPRKQGDERFLSWNNKSQ